MILPELLESAARAWPDQEAVRDERGALSFAQLRARARRLAGALSAEGWGAGQRVVLLARNQRASVELGFALFELGAALVPVNWRLRPGEVAAIVRDARATAVFADAELAPLLAGLELPRFALGAPPAGWRACAELLAREPGPAPIRAPAPGDVAVQMYTSGTTGTPKGSMLSHANILAVTTAWLAEMELCAGDRFLQVTPLFHVGGLLMMVSCVAAGATLRLCSEFAPAGALAILREEGVSHALFVPAMIRMLLDEDGLSRGGFERLRLIVYGAAPMPVSALERALEAFGCDFLQGYGLTETAGVLTALRPADHRYPDPSAPPRRLASIGTPIRCSEVAVVDEAGSDVAVGEVGEIVARGPNVHLGYWQRQAEDPVRREGWFHTGDLATVDEEGYLYIVDRRKDMICVSGENVYPREVERVLALHPALVDAAVIGIPHRHWGEEVLALVVLTEGASVTDRELIQHCRGPLARFKCPTRIQPIDAIPRNAAGKIDKALLRAPWWQGHERKV